MALETRTELTQEAIESIQGLIRINKDSQLGFEEASENVDDARLAGLFRDLADERANQAGELKSFVNYDQQSAESDGSFTGMARRLWIDLRTALGGGRQLILEEAERNEDQIKAKYEEAVKCCGGSSVSDVINRQYAAVRTAHDRIRDLRDANRTKPK